MLDAFVGIAGCTHSRSDTQCTAIVFTRQRIIDRFLEILGGNHAAQFKIIVDDQDFLDTVPVQ